MSNIKETEHYYITTGIALNSKDKNDISYKIINKRYGVTEVETSILPQALKYIDDLEAGLAALQDMDAGSHFVQSKEKDKNLSMSITPGNVTQLKKH